MWINWFDISTCGGAIILQHWMKQILRATFPTTHINHKLTLHDASCKFIWLYDWDMYDSLTKNTYTPLQYNDACIYFTEIRNWYIQGDKTQKKGTTLQMYSQRYCVEDKYY